MAYCSAISAHRQSGNSAPGHVRTTSLPLLVSAALASGCAASLQVDPAVIESLDIAVSFENPRPEVLEVQFHRGFVVVQKGSALECQLEVDLTGTDRLELTELRDRIRPSIQEAPDGSRTVLRTGLPAGGRLNSIQTRYLLRVPEAVKLLVSTREGSVYVRDFGGHVDVEAGRGVIEVELDGGFADLSTDSGSISLRGDYTTAEVESGTGRIRVSLPAGPLTPVDLEVRSMNGDTFLEVPEDRVFTLHYNGDESRLRMDSLVELDWIEVGDDGGEEFLVGRIGPDEGVIDGHIRVRNGKGVVRLRPLPAARP